MSENVEIEGIVYESSDSGSNDAESAADRSVSASLLEEDLALERSLRPKTLSEELRK